MEERQAVVAMETGGKMDLMGNTDKRGVVVWSFGAGQREEILIVFLNMTTCTTTTTTIYDTHGVVRCSWQNGALWEGQCLLPADSGMSGKRMCVFILRRDVYSYAI